MKDKELVEYARQLADTLDDCGNVCERYVDDAAFILRRLAARLADIRKKPKKRPSP